MVIGIDTGEAIKCLDAFSDDLTSMSLLVGSSTLQNKADQDALAACSALKNRLVEKQQEAMKLAVAIVTAKDRWPAGAISIANIFGFNDAVGRYVLADRQASDALKLPQESATEIWWRGMAEIHKEVAARDRAENETKAKAATPANEVTTANSVSTGTVDDAAAGHPELPGNP